MFYKWFDKRFWSGPKLMIISRKRSISLLLYILKLNYSWLTYFHIVSKWVENRFRATGVEIHLEWIQTETNLLLSFWVVLEEPGDHGHFMAVFDILGQFYKFLWNLHSNLRLF